MNKNESRTTELKNDCACVISDPVGEAVSAKISTWPTHSEWKTLEFLDFAVKFQLVFRYETVVFRRHVLLLLLVVLLWKFEAYLVYLGLIWSKFYRRFLCFQKFRHLVRCFPIFPRKLLTCAIVFQFCHQVQEFPKERVFIVTATLALKVSDGKYSLIPILKFLTFQTS